MNAKLPIGSIGYILSLLIVGSASAADDSTSNIQDRHQTCVSLETDFSSTGALTKAVVASKERRVRLYRNHPNQCGSDESCLGKAYLVPGDEVDVARSCGIYARVRYVGTSHTTVGWIEDSALEKRSADSNVGGSPEDHDIDNPIAFMFQKPLTDNSDAGGFYSGSLADGTGLNANVFYAAGTQQKGPIATEAVWFPQDFNGRVMMTVVSSTSSANDFTLSLKSCAKEDSCESEAPGISARAVSPTSPAGGLGNFMEPPRVVDVTLTGKLSADKQHIEGKWLDNTAKRQQTFSLERLFKYRSLKKRWPFYGDENPTSAEFTATFPILPYSNVQDQVVKDSAGCDADATCESEITVVSSWNGFVTLRTWGFSKSTGATGEYGAGYSVYRVHDGGAERKKIDEVINLTGECAHRLGAIVARRLNTLLRRVGTEAAGVLTDSASSLTATNSFIVSPLGITLHYQPMSLNTPAADGEFFVTLSRVDLAGCTLD